MGEVGKARKSCELASQKFRTAENYKGKVKDEFKSLRAELRGQQQALVKARREVRRLVGKRSEERMMHEKLQAEHEDLRKQLQTLQQGKKNRRRYRKAKPSPQSG